MQTETGAELNNKRPREEEAEEGGPDKKRASGGALDGANGGAANTDPPAGVSRVRWGPSMAPQGCAEAPSAMAAGGARRSEGIGTKSERSTTPTPTLPPLPDAAWLAAGPYGGAGHPCQCGGQADWQGWRDDPQPPAVH